MKNIYFSILILFFFTVTSCRNENKKNIEFKGFKIDIKKDEEPPLIFEVIAESESQFFIENERKKWNITLTKPVLEIKVHNWKLFPHNNIEFEYPRTYSFKSDLSLTNDIWILSGNNLIIMVIRPIVSMGLNEYTEQMVEQFGRLNCKTESISKDINRRKFNGKKLSITLAGTNIEMEILELIDSTGKKSFLIFQDTLDEDYKHSSEYHNTMKKIQKTLKIK